jgi:VanZ family protein
MKHSKWFWLWLCLTLGATAFILYNGSQNAKDSISASDGLIALLTPILDAIASFLGNLDWHFWIRKGAHVTEYALLGFCAFFLAKEISKVKGHSFGVYAAFYGLSVAVTDEFIQGFVGRTSAVYDVLIDFGGCLLGFACAVILPLLWNSLKSVFGRKKRKKKI